jgi:hypothetical protein
VLDWQTLRQCGPDKSALGALDFKQVGQHFSLAPLAFLVAQCRAVVALGVNHRIEPLEHRFRTDGPCRDRNSIRRCEGDGRSACG